MKKWFISFICVNIILLIIFGTMVIYIDPWFHFHEPLKGISYVLDQGNMRYQNDGIAKNYEYDALIAGTSMIENTRTSEIDSYFNVKTIKLPASGALYKEVNSIITTALENNSNIKYVFRGLDYGYWLFDKDESKFDENYYPSYLYDGIGWNDINYIYNKRALAFCLYDVMNSIQGNSMTSFDDYAYTANDAVYSKETVLLQYNRLDIKNDESYFLLKEEEQIIKDNIYQNVTNVAENYPDVEFYYFLTPYSICYWDSLDREGNLIKELEAEKIAIEEILRYDNIHLFSFNNEYDIICNLDNYKDNGHYSPSINSLIIYYMKNDYSELTTENYMQYWEEEYSFYTSYDYDSIWK